MKKIILLLLSIVLLNSVYSQDYEGYDGCAEQDSLALVAFYWATDGPNWTSNQDGFSINDLSDDVLVYHTTDYPYAGMGKWLEGPVKDWFGVLLEKQQVGNTTDSVWRVIHLRPTISRRSAGDNNLSGYVPKEVGMLTALQWFKVNGNVGLIGALPDEIYQPTLQKLDLESVYFSGDISSAIRKCTRLDFINVRYNYFDTVPVFDFQDPDVLGAFSVWFYQNQISWATLEPTVEYFVANNATYEARDQKNVGRAREVVVAPGSSVTLTSNDAGSQGTYTWYKKGLNTYITGPQYTISSVSASDTGNYTVLVGNEFIRLNDENADYVNTFTKPIHLTFIPSTPFCNKLETSYNGQKIYLTFSKPMASPSVAQADEFTVTAGGATIDVVGVQRMGRLNDILVLELSTPIVKGQEVLISYSAGTVVDKNGGQLQSFTDKTVTNLVREAPVLVDAITRANGESVILTFDAYIDGETLDPSYFEIMGSDGNSIVAAQLVDGSLDENISKQVELVMNEPMLDTDVLTVSYTMGKTNALFGGTLQSFTNESVTNVITAVRTDVNLIVIDGTGEFQQVVVKGEMKSLPFELFDDGTNGDNISGDHIWTKSMSLANGSYKWEVYSRRIEVVYDTVTTVNGEGQITMVITPSNVNVDSLISGDLLLRLSVENGVSSGDSIFEYKNNTLTFILDMKEFFDNNPGVALDPYLMGIKEDWSDGFAMTVLDSSETQLTYSVTVGGFGLGETVGFNFRNGSLWENQTAATRTHVVAGNDVINAEYGKTEVVGIETLRSGDVIVYPNPVSDNLYIKVKDGQQITAIKIYNLQGACIYHEGNPSSVINTGFLPNGSYIIEINLDNRALLRKQLLKL